MELKRVVITGLGALTPIGNNAPDFWDALLKGKNGVGLITHFDASEYKTKFACELKDFDITKYLDSKEVHRLDRCSQHAYIAVKEALADSQIDLTTANKDRIGIIMGTGIGGITTAAEGIIDFARNNLVPHFNPFFILKALSNMVSGNLSIMFDLRGPNYTTSAACASAAVAVADAYHYIQLGKVDVMLSGGTEAGICELGIGGFNAMRALSTRNDDYLTASRPFSIGRDGFVMGEGAGALILEEYEHAKARNAHIYAEIAGIGISSDAYHITAPHPDGRGAITAMQNALDDAHIPPNMVDHINTHGTSTQQGDVTECKAIAEVFGAHTQEMLFNSTKSMTGHLLGAAAAIESIACIFAINHGIVPPTINMVEKDPAIPDWNFCSNQAVKKDIQFALNNSFGFGGHNISILFKKI
jgi:3-oxoacyl-[acyl-carrier-protein] synthase II